MELLQPPEIYKPYICQTSKSVILSNVLKPKIGLTQIIKNYKYLLIFGSSIKITNVWLFTDNALVIMLFLFGQSFTLTHVNLL